MGFLSKLFGQHGSVKAELRRVIRSDINIADALIAHVSWKARLENYLNGNSAEELDPMVICRDDQCMLGKWIHGPALTYLNDNDGFFKLRKDHANFHFVAGNVVKKMQENDKTAAYALMQNEYDRVSSEIVNDLMELKQLLTDE